jgi:hypothetical protein
VIRLFLAASCAISFLMMASDPVVADDAAMQKYRNFLPEQILALPEKVRQSEVPIAYLQAANIANSELANHVFGAMLNVLMYKGISDYDAAVRSFQQDMGGEPTGKLTVWQIYQLKNRSEMQRISPPNLPGFFRDVKVPGYATLEGTLQMLDERAAFPVNKVKIKCVQNDGYCTLDEIDVEFPKETDWVLGFTVFWTSETQYKISKWTNDLVEADYEVSGLGKPCRNTKLQLNFKAKEYYMITTNAGEECEVLGAKLSKLVKPRISKIVDGEEIIKAEYNEFHKRKYEKLASEYRNRIAEAIEKEK